LMPMARKPFRVEVVYLTRGKPHYYLVRDVKVGQSKRKIRKYIGTRPPTPAELEDFRNRYAYDMEMRAAKKKAEMSGDYYRTEYISGPQQVKLEYLRHLYKTFTDLLTVNEVEYYEKEFEIHYIHGTTSIEGNSLSIRETRDLLENNIVPKNKSLRELNEIQNFKHVVEYRKRYRGRVSMDFIRNLHALIMNNIDIESAGTFRRIDSIAIAGCDLRLCPALMVETELRELLDRYYANLDKKKNPFEQAVLFHYHFEMIHPFTDGNGRVGREILNYMLVRSGYPRMLFPGRDREKYIGTLKLGNEGKFPELVNEFIEIISTQRLGILDKNLKKVILRPKKTGQLRLDDFVKV
jgi:fido (protein-threonine AMPylation protein)